MSKEHFSLLVKTLELEEKLANENFTNFSLDNIEKDNKNKMWTFNFSGKSLPSSEEFALFIQKLRESFQGEYLVKYCLNIEKKVSIEEIKEYWKFVILENFSELAPVLLESILFSKIDVNDNILSLNIMAPSIWNNFINEKKSQILGSYANLGIILKDIRPVFSKTDVDAVLENQEKKISKLRKKKQKQEQKLKNNGLDGKTQGAKSAVITSSMVNQYLESGKEDNAGVDAAYKVTGQVENISRKVYHSEKKKNLKRQKKITKLEKSIENQEKKLFFQKNMEEMKKSADYQNTSRLRQFFKRRQYKMQIQKKYKDSVKNRIKKSLIESSKHFGEFVKSRGKKIVFLSLLALGIFFMLFQAGSMMMNMGTGMVGNTVSTTYLSSEDVLKETNQEFSSLEQALQEEMDSVEENHPGYDEYIINGKEKIGHNVHELLSYITARYGIVKNISEVESELQSLFQNMYTLTYKEEIEIRYKTVTSSYTDADGNEHTESHEEPYEYKKLIVTLEKREMDSIIREVFQSYPDNLSHYEILLASKGNMELLFGNGSGDFSEIINNPDFSNPGLEFNEESVKRIVHEAEKHIGKRYVFGANGPSNFDCSSFVCWTYTHSGIKNMPRTTAWGIYKNYCNPVSPSEAKAGDIIFFKGTYNSGSPISHVGIYVGGGYMIHAGDPIQYARIDTPYWRDHFYGFGRPK